MRGQGGSVMMGDGAEAMSKGTVNLVWRLLGVDSVGQYIARDSKSRNGRSP
jgi:hypothetical protein